MIQTVLEVYERNDEVLDLYLVKKDDPSAPFILNGPDLELYGKLDPDTPDESAEISMSTEAGTIELVDGPTGHVKLKFPAVQLVPGRYRFRIDEIDGNDARRTRVAGQLLVWNV